MPTTIAVIYDNKNDAFFPGQVITGRVEVTTTKSKNVRGNSI